MLLLLGLCCVILDYVKYMKGCEGVGGGVGGLFVWWCGVCVECGCVGCGDVE